MSTIIRQSPVAAVTAASASRLVEHHGMSSPDGYAEAQAEVEAVAQLAIADVSVLPKLGIKGPEAAAQLTALDLALPNPIYGQTVQADGCRVYRMDRCEWFIEDGLKSETVARVNTSIGLGGAGVYLYGRQDCGLLLSGAGVLDVFAQTCGYDWREAKGQVVLTRCAGVSVAVVSAQLDDRQPPAYRLWCAPSYGLYLWETLLEIVTSLGGRPVGLAAVERWL